MANYIGIDLGTTYSVVATLDETGRPIVIENNDKQVSPKGNITASCVMVGSQKLIVGEQARKALPPLSNNAVGRFKREMGKETTYEIAGESYTPTDLSAAVLVQMKKIAQEAVGELSKVVVTVPANFANEAREATMQAAKKAGLDIDFIINEPTAAALNYAYKIGKELKGKYAFYDLGGGTFDISILSIDGEQIDVLASNGIAQLGGMDFDRELTKLVERKFKEETGRDLDYTCYDPSQAEEDKMALSNKKRIVAGGIEQNIDGVTLRITQSEFEEVISGLLAQTSLVCDATLEQAKVSMEDIDGVVLVGGSTRIPAVKQLVERVFGKPPIDTENPDEAVALGAVLYAATKSDGEHLTKTQQQNIEKISVQEITNHYYGTVACDVEDESQLHNSIIIKKGENIPCSITKSYFTIKDGQIAVNCRVTQSENDESDLKWVNLVREKELELPPNRPEGREIQATYSYDDNQIMHCVFKDIESGRVVEMDIEIASSESDDSPIDQFLVD